MVKIEELLMPGEKLIKKQGGVTLGRGAFGVPTRDLVLTNHRLFFIPSRAWALMLSDPSLFGRRDVTEVAMEDIKKVKKSWGALKIQADKEYT